jgi:hypothetical protein
VAFWLTVIHFLAFGCLTAIAIKDSGTRTIPDTNVLEAYQQFGLATGAGLVLLTWYWVVWLLTVAADWAALAVFWQLGRGQARRTRLAAYLFFVLALLAIHETAMAGILWGVAGRGLLWALLGTYAATVAVLDVLMAAPAALLLGGGVIFGWRRTPPPGFCAVCGYNLTANTSGVCPECGTLSPHEPEAELTIPIPHNE